MGFKKKERPIYADLNDQSSVRCITSTNATADGRSTVMGQKYAGGIDLSNGPQSISVEEINGG